MKGYSTGRRDARYRIRFRKTPLAACLAASLVFSLSGPLMARGSDPLVVRGDHSSLLLQSQTSGNTVAARPDGQLADMADAAMQRFLATQAASVVTAATMAVNNCNDSGGGSLRAAVTFASNGDTIDMSGVPGDCTILLVNSIVTSVDTLTIKGKANSKFPIIDGQNNVRLIVHPGAGTLTLQDTYLRNGTYAAGNTYSSGGCIYSSGNVSLINSELTYCNLENRNDGTPRGGAIFSYGDVTLSNSTISQSTARTSGSGDAQGGAIYSFGDVTLSDSTISQNTARTFGNGDARGGGIWSWGTTALDGVSGIIFNTAEAEGGGVVMGGGVYSAGNLTVKGSSAISSNTARANTGFAAGGGAHVAADVAVKYCQIEDNVVESDDFFAQGGGLKVKNTLTAKYTTIANNEANAGYLSIGGGVYAGGDVSISSTTISGNSAQQVGGLYLPGRNATSPLTISRSTVSGNVSTNSRTGAGIYMGYDGSIANSTITGNVERNPGDDKYGAGLSMAGGVNVNLSSTIVSGNLLKLADNSTLPSDTGAKNNSGSASLSGDHNLISWTTIDRPADTIVSPTPGLGALADNGGLTLTHALLSDSKAIDKGAANSSEFDQRGEGFKRVAGSSADIGAFEYGGDVIFTHGFESP